VVEEIYPILLYLYRYYNWSIHRGFISWLIYNRQEKISKTQDTMLSGIKKLQDKQEHI
jgi:hypothetical protein